MLFYYCSSVPHLKSEMVILPTVIVLFGYFSLQDSFCYFGCFVLYKIQVFKKNSLKNFFGILTRIDLYLYISFGSMTISKY